MGVKETTDPKVQFENQSKQNLFGNKHSIPFIHLNDNIIGMKEIKTNFDKKTIKTFGQRVVLTLRAYQKSHTANI